MNAGILKNNIRPTENVARVIIANLECGNIIKRMVLNIADGINLNIITISVLSNGKNLTNNKRVSALFVNDPPVVRSDSALIITTLQRKSEGSYAPLATEH